MLMLPCCAERAAYFLEVYSVFALVDVAMSFFVARCENHGQMQRMVIRKKQDIISI